jgi:small subunit ribosomal protein S3
MKELKGAGIADVVIERTPKHVSIFIHAGKPGVIIGRQGAGIEELKKKVLTTFFRGRRVTLHLNVAEVGNPSLNAKLVGEQIASDIEKRLPFRRSMKSSIERVMKSGAKGVKITLSGRLNGAEIARTETLSQGSVPLHNLRADIDFARVRANTVFGVIGIKMWIYKGDVFESASQGEAAETDAETSKKVNRAPRK